MPGQRRAQVGTTCTTHAPNAVYGIRHRGTKKAQEAKTAADLRFYLERVGESNPPCELGGLVLLPKSLNASYGDLPYEEKLPHYRGQNILAACLHPDTYRNNPNLRRVIEQTGWPLEPHEAFPRPAIDQRQDLYLSMAATIWSPDRLRNG